MIGIIIALVIALGVGGTVVADTAGPGDLLFPVDQAVETIRLSLTGDDKKNELRIKFAEERIGEIEDRVSESTDESIDADKRSFPVEEQENVTIGIEAVLNLLAQLKEQEQGDSRIDSIATKLNEYMTDLPSNARIEVGEDKLHIKFEDDESDDNTDGDTDSEVEIKNESKNGTVKAEIRTDEGRIKIEVKNGVLEIKTKLDDDSNDDKQEDTTDSDSKDSDDELEEIEAKILSDKTVVEIEVDNEKTTFTTSAISREAIIAAIIEKFPSLTSAQITAVLKIEAEDDSSAENDDQDDDSDNDSNSDDNKEQDDNQSDSNSGSDDNR